MKLRDGGIDIFYMDESQDKNIFVATAIAIPFLRWQQQGWHIVWPDYFEKAQQWRQRLADDVRITVDKELHGLKLAKGRGHYLYGSLAIPRKDCANIYRHILQTVDFAPDASIFSVADFNGSNLFGQRPVRRTMTALLRHIHAQALAHNMHAMVFFDEGHPEYRALYRDMQRTLGDDIFIKDGNEKISRHCHFTQLADLISYAALAKLRHELGTLSEKDTALGLHTIHDAMPRRFCHLGERGDGIIWLG